MILYLDTETTGLYPGNICQLSYIMQTKKSTCGRNYFFNVEYVEAGAYAVHGFSVERLMELSNGKCFADFSKNIQEDFLSANLIVSHNTAFDFMFLRKEMESCGLTFQPNDSFCSMKNSTCVCRLKRNSGGYKYPKLSELCAYFEIKDEDIEKCSHNLFGQSTTYHDARFDTAGVFLAVNKMMDLPEFEYLKDLL